MRETRDPGHYVAPLPVVHCNGVSFSAPQAALDWFGYEDGQHISEVGLAGVRRQAVVVMTLNGIFQQLLRAAGKR